MIFSLPGSIVAKEGDRTMFRNGCATQKGCSLSSRAANSGKMEQTLYKSVQPPVLVDLLLIRLRHQHQVKLSCLFIEVTSRPWPKNGFGVLGFL